MYVSRNGLVAFIIIALVFSPQSQASSFLSSFLNKLKVEKSTKSTSTGSAKKVDLVKNLSCQFSGYSKTGPAAQDIEFIDEEKTVCDPLSNQVVDSSESGLLGKLLLKSNSMQAKTTSVLEYHEKGIRLEQNLYFADINVPTRRFDKGFENRAGDVLVDTNGEKLIENFAIEYSSSLRLQASDKPGHYEISLLSDDGARLFALQNGAWSEIVNNDGVHQTRMGCAYKTVYLDHASEIPIKVLYYQGPRYHIANVMMWKLHKKSKTWKQPARHSLCGIMGNSVFFNENKKGDTLAMKVLNRQGWAIVAPQNFKMPEQTPNPCIDESLKVTNFKIDEIGSGYAILSWTTNVPSTSQIKISANSQSYTSPLDENMVMEHVVRIDGLERGYTYTVQAISTDANGVEALSPPPPVSFDQ